MAALDHYNLRKRKAIGDFVELRANTRQYLNAFMPYLEELDHWSKAPRRQRHAIFGRYSSVAAPAIGRSRQGLRFPKKVRDYFETMMSHIGYAPLAIV